MTWDLNNAPAPRDPSSGWLIINDVQYPPDWPHDDLIALGLEWVEPEPSAPDLTAPARQLLAASDIVVLRCYEAGLAVPAEWASYRDALRAVVRADSGDLPERPEYPGGEE